MNIKKIFEKNKLILLQDTKRLGKSAWVVVKTKSGAVEGKIHLPKNKTSKLVIFEPGSPGDGSTRLEKLWLSTLLQKKCAVFAVRHNGTIINGKYASTYINCPDRQTKAKNDKQKLLGIKKEFSIKDWLIEPYVVLESLTPHFDEIYLVGHSFRSLASLFSLIDFSKNYPNQTKKIKRFVSLAGGIGKVRSDSDPILTQWLEYLGKKEIRERISIGSPKRNLELLKKAYIKNYKLGKNLPKNIEMMFLSPWGDTTNSRDELCPLVESLEMLSSIGRGYLIIDKTQRGNEKTGQLAHDLDNLRAKSFHNLVNHNWLPKNQISVLV